MSHREISAHLLAADRNRLKHTQHLTAATQLANAAGIPHFGRWNDQQITRRAAQHALEETRLALKDGPSRYAAERNYDPTMAQRRYVAETAGDVEGEPRAIEKL